MEGFDVAVLPGATWFDEDCFRLDLSESPTDLVAVKSGRLSLSGCFCHRIPFRIESDSEARSNAVRISHAPPKSDTANLRGSNQSRVREQRRKRSKFGDDQRPVIKIGDQPRESHIIIHRRKSLPQSTSRRGFLKRVKTTLESQLEVRGQAVTLGSTPKATLFEPCPFRKLVATSSSTENDGQSVASDLWRSE